MGTVVGDSAPSAVNVSRTSVSLRGSDTNAVVITASNRCAAAAADSSATFPTAYQEADVPDSRCRPGRNRSCALPSTVRTTVRCGTSITTPPAASTNPASALRSICHTASIRTPNVTASALDSCRTVAPPDRTNSRGATCREATTTLSGSDSSDARASSPEVVAVTKLPRAAPPSATRISNVGWVVLIVGVGVGLPDGFGVGCEPPEVTCNTTSAIPNTTNSDPLNHNSCEVRRRRCCSAVASVSFTRPPDIGRAGQCRTPPRPAPGSEWSARLRLAGGCRWRKCPPPGYP